MIQRDRIELIVVAVIGAVLGGITGIALGHDWLATLIWALIGAVAGLFIFLGGVR
jgi:outer membrane lipoprotein SlyB